MDPDLIAACLADPGDRTRRLVLADWLADQGREDDADALRADGQWVLAWDDSTLLVRAWVFWEDFRPQAIGRPLVACGITRTPPRCESGIISESPRGPTLNCRPDAKARATVWRGRWLCWTCAAFCGRCRQAAAIVGLSPGGLARPYAVSEIELEARRAAFDPMDVDHPDYPPEAED